LLCDPFSGEMFYPRVGVSAFPSRTNRVLWVLWPVFGVACRHSRESHHAKELASSVNEAFAIEVTDPLCLWGCKAPPVGSIRE
jgi:hypothetical protein